MLIIIHCVGNNSYLFLCSQPDYDEIDENGYKAFSSTRPSKEKLLSTDKKYGEKLVHSLSFYSFPIVQLYKPVIVS